MTSSGSVQPVGNINIVQSYAGGFVKAINVKEGDYVHAGDLLIELNTETLVWEISLSTESDGGAAPRPCKLLKKKFDQNFYATFVE